MENPLPDTLYADTEEFFTSEHTRPRGLDIYPEVFHSRLFPLQKMAEVLEMVQTARRLVPQAKTVMEIGIDRGFGFYNWIKSIATIRRAVGCEFRGCPCADLFELAFPDVDFLWLPVSSYDPTTVATFAKWLGDDKLDILFIDGDKCHFYTDWSLYKQFMNPNGVVFMHDVNPIPDPTPRIAWELALAEGYSGREIRDLTEPETNGTPDCGYNEWARYWGTTSCGVGVIQMNRS